MQGIGKTGEIIETGMGKGDIEAKSIASRLANFAGLEIGQFTDMLADAARHLAQQIRPFARRAMPPVGVESPPAVPHRLVDDVGSAGLDPRHIQAGGRILHGEDIAFGRVGEFAADDGAPKLLGHLSALPVHASGPAYLPAV